MATYPDLTNDVEFGKYPVLPVGTYTFTIDSITSTDDSGKFLLDKNGHKVVKVAYSTEVNGQPYKLFDNLVFDEDYKYANMHRSKMKSLVMAVGGDVEGGEYEDLVGLSFSGQTKNSEFNGNVYANIVKYAPLGAGGASDDLGL